MTQQAWTLEKDLAGKREAEVKKHHVDVPQCRRRTRRNPAAKLPPVPGICIRGWALLVRFWGLSYGVRVLGFGF